MHDIECAEKEKHTLPSTHYVAPKKVIDNSSKEEVQSRMTANGIQRVGEFGDHSRAERSMQSDHVDILSALAKARLRLSQSEEMSCNHEKGVILAHATLSIHW